MVDFIQDIYNTRLEYNDEYPEAPGMKDFDLHRKQLLYGRIDRDGNAIYLHDSNLDQIWTGEENTEFAIDFVCDAFEWLKNHVTKARRQLDPNSVYSVHNLRVTKAWRAGDLEYSYYRYLNNIYTDFVQNYLEENRRYEKISDFNSFLINFSKYMSSIAYYFPLTKTGYILSHHCSPFVSGMMVEIAKQGHGTQRNKAGKKYNDDPNFPFIKNAAKKFGFMVDRNAPWRLVFNVASGGLRNKNELALSSPPTFKKPFGEKKKLEEEYSGAAYFMAQYGVSFSRTSTIPIGLEDSKHPYETNQSNHVFDKYYVQAHLEEIENLRNYLFLFYSAFHSQFDSYTKLEVYGAPKRPLCNNVKLKLKYLNREALPGLATTTGPLDDPKSIYIPSAFTATYTDQFWLNYILKFRLLETAAPHDNMRYKYFQKKMLDIHSAFGTKAALNYINNLTKGLFATKFIHEAEHWYGQPRTVVEARRKLALENVGSDQFELTGVLNNPK